MQLAGTVSIRAHLDADVKSSELVGLLSSLVHSLTRGGEEYSIVSHSRDPSPSIPEHEAAI